MWEALLGLLNSPASNADHPRVCGEHRLDFAQFRRHWGITPAYAGNTRQKRDGERASGITPAYDAGSTTAQTRTQNVRWDHPRVCGEHYDGEDVLILDEGSPRVCGEHGVSGGFHFNAIGSSPPMRGARFARVTSAKWLGIIPAYAGSTFSASTIVAELWDHPRVCGEHNRPHPRSTLITGSSPHMRGAPGSIDVIL